MFPLSCINWLSLNCQIYFLCLYLILVYMSMVPDNPIIVIVPFCCTNLIQMSLVSNTDVDYIVTTFKNRLKMYITTSMD